MTRKQRSSVAKRRRHSGGGVTRAGKAAFGAAIALGAAGAATTGAQAADIPVSNTNDSGPGSLRDAIDAANLTPASDQIIFQAGLSGDITLASGLPALTSPVQITGPGRATLAVNGVGQYRIFEIDTNATISGLTLKNGYAETPPYCPYPCFTPLIDGGGAVAIEEDGIVTVEGVDFINNVAEDAGGAVYALVGSKLTVKDSGFSGNEAVSGGAVRIRGGYPSQSELSISGSTFSGNSAVTPPYSYSQGGGAVNLVGVFTATITGSSFDSNTASRRGGALSGGYGSTSISKSTFTNNSSSDSSGGAANLDGIVDVTESSFTGNTASYSGGAASFGGRINVSGSSFSSNTSGYSGGALQLSPFQSSSVSGSTFSANKAGQNPSLMYGGNGGAINLTGAGRARLRNLTVAGNTAAGGAGGGVFSRNDSSELDSVTVSGNSATTKPSGPQVKGGGIYQSSGTLEMNNSIVSGNTSPSGADLAGGPGGYYGVGPAGQFDASFSLIGNSAGEPVNDVIPGSNLTGVDPQLGPLANNGGLTATMLPADTSPVVNKGMSSLATDQRALTRPVDFAGIPFSTAAGANGADMGAVELQYTPPPPPPPPPADARINRVTVKGPAKARKGKPVTYKVRISNNGGSAATGVRLRVSGRGVKVNTAVGRIAAGKTRIVSLRVRFRRTGKVTGRFRVTSTNAGNRTAKKVIRVRR